jgi:hypothetical protein
MTQKTQFQASETKAQEQPKEAAQEPVKEKKAKSLPVDHGKYDRYTALKFVALSGTKLKDEQNKEMNELETELKKCSGKVPVRTVRAAISNEQALLVKGIPVPEKIEKLIESASKSDYYFGE